MSKLFTIFILLFSLIFSSSSFAEWKKVSISYGGDVYYVDTDTLKRVGNLVYVSSLRDYVKPDKWGDLSNIVYLEINCDNHKYKRLSLIYYILPMGKGTPSTIDNTPNDVWHNTDVGSVQEGINNFVCSYSQ